LYVLVPTGLGATVLLLVALFFEQPFWHEKVSGILDLNKSGPPVEPMGL
jgi:hypothetical protein